MSAKLISGVGMFKVRWILSLAAILPALAIFSSLSFAQVYSFIDHNGVRILTNIAPTAPVSDLKITGAPPVVPEPAAKPRPATKKSNKTSPAAKANAGSAFPSKSDAYDHIIQKYADAYSLDPKLIHSMIATESGFNANAVSPKGARGLMQLMPETASRLGVRDPFDPEDNISGGTKYMRFLLDTFSYDPKERLVLSLAAYNAGENLVQRLGRVPAIRETNDYVRSIIQRYGKRTMDEPAPTPGFPSAPPTYRYVDENGVLVLTNIAPAEKSGNDNQPGGSRPNPR